MNITALDTFLGPLKALFAEEGIQEISINRPGEAWVEKFGEMRREVLPEMTLEHMRSLAHLIAQSTSQSISEEKPLLSANLPGGYRIQIIIPPACDAGVVMAIRKQTALDMDLDKYEALGAFQNTKTGIGHKDPVDAQLQ